jgi:hypothetical protein
MLYKASNLERAAGLPWIHVAEGTVQWPALVNTLINFRVS